MAKARLKAGETVVVISGAHKGKEGKLLQVLPRKNRAIVEGVNMVKKHQRKTQDSPQGAIIEREGSIHVSNLMAAKKHEERLARRGVAKPKAEPKVKEKSEAEGEAD